jgi:hypothetical protein
MVFDHQFGERLPLLGFPGPPNQSTNIQGINILLQIYVVHISAFLLIEIFTSFHNTILQHMIKSKFDPQVW